MADTQTRPCPNCGGTGETAQRDADGVFVGDCPDCNGTGQVPYKGSKPAAPPPATPAAVAHADALGVDLSQVEGSGAAPDPGAAQ